MRLLVSTLISAFLLSSCATTRFQNGVEVRKESGFLGGLVYKQKDETIHRPELAEGLEQTPATREAMESYRTPNVLRQVFGFAGGFLVGWPVGQTIAGVDNPNWTLAIIGSGAIVVSAIFEGVANRKIDHAVDLYNQSLTAGKSSPKKSELSPKLFMTQVGNAVRPTVGLAFRY